MAGLPWRHHGLAGLCPRVARSFAALCRHYPIVRLVPEGHGSGGVPVSDAPEEGGTGAVLPTSDYEEPFPEAIDDGYLALAGSFEGRGSAVMMA